MLLGQQCINVYNTLTNWVRALKSTSEVMCRATVDLTVQCVGQLKLLVGQMVQNWVFEGNNSKNSSISLLGLIDV